MKTFFKKSLFFIFLVVVLVILNFNFTYSVNNDIGFSTQLNNTQLAFKEVAYSYYMRSVNIQYNSLKVGYFKPEEATEQNVNYTVCSGLVKNIYYELLGEKYGFYLPNSTTLLLNYGKDNFNRSEVIAYGNYNSSDKKIHMKVKNKAGTVKELVNPSLNDFMQYLRVGDIVTHTGHTMVVYDVKYDASGNVSDVIIMESGHGEGGHRVYAKIANAAKVPISPEYGNANHYLYHNKRDNSSYPEGDIEGSLHIGSIKDEYMFTKTNMGNCAEYSVIRIINEDNTFSYDGTVAKSPVFNNQSIELGDNTKGRLLYSKLYVEKTVDKGDDNLVNPGDTLVYTIIVQNKSKSDYTQDLIVKEALSKYVTYVSSNSSKNNNTFTKNGTTLSWNIGKLKAGEKVKITYTVKVNSGTVGGTITSIGTVGNSNKSNGVIDNTVVKNRIGEDLTSAEKSQLVSKFNSLKGTYNGRELINEVYKQATGIDLKLSTFNFNDLITDAGNSSIRKSITLNKNSYYYDMVLNQYWNVVATKDYTYNGTNIKVFDLKSFRDYSATVPRRQDTVYASDFKTGDILIYTNSDDSYYTVDSNNLKKYTVSYENGEYIYMYIESQGFVGVNLGADKTNGTKDDRNVFDNSYFVSNNIRSYSDKSITDPSLLEFFNYQTLFGKDKYVIIRPVLKQYYEPLSLSVSYSTTSVTNKSVKVTIKSNIELKELSGWVLSSDKLSLTKDYSSNVDNNISVSSVNGSKTVNIKINNIDKTPPVLKAEYTKNTSNYTVKISSNEVIQNVSDWTLSSDKKSITKTFNPNVSQSINVYDLAGNKSTIQIKTDNIEELILNVSYSTTNITNNDVKVTIKSNIELKELSGWVLSSDKLSLSRDYSNNVDTSVSVSSVNGTKSVNVKVGNIDKIAPVLEVDYVQSENNYLVKVYSNEKIKSVSGWELSQDGKVLTKSYAPGTVSSITVYDLANNKATLSFNVPKIKVNNVISYLKDLKISNGTLSPSFSSKVFEYKVKVDTSYIIVTPKLNSDGSSLLDTKTRFDLKYGENTIVIGVRSKTDDIVKYRLYVTRVDNRDRNNLLKALSIKNVRLEQSFEKEKYSYSAKVDNSVSSVYIDGVLDSNKASFVNGYGPRNVSLSVGKSVALIKIKNELGEIKEYSITITREAKKEEPIVVPEKPSEPVVPEEPEEEEPCDPEEVIVPDESEFEEEPSLPDELEVENQNVETIPMDIYKDYSHLKEVIIYVVCGLGVCVVLFFVGIVRRVYVK